MKTSSPSTWTSKIPFAPVTTSIVARSSSCCSSSRATRPAAFPRAPQGTQYSIRIVCGSAIRRFCQQARESRSGSLRHGRRPVADCRYLLDARRPVCGGALSSMVAHPFVYEINTWAWLDELSRRAGATVDLASVPDAEWEAVASLGLRRRLADGRLGAEPGGDRDRAGQPVARRGLPACAARLRARRRRRLAVLHPRLRGGRPARRPRGPRRRTRGARAARARADPRLRPQPRRARPSMARRAPGVLRPRRRGRPRARPVVVRPRRRRRRRERARPVLPGVAGRRAARRVLGRSARRRDGDAAVDRDPVRRRPLRHGDARDERRLRADVGRARGPAARATTTGRR